MNFSSLKEILKGNFSKSFMIKRVLPMKFFIFIGLIITSIILFPEPYLIISEYVSNLGNPIFNPLGWFLFSMAFIFLAMTFIPCVLYLHKKLEQIYKVVTKIGTIFNFIASIGMFMLALFPNLDILMIPHATAAILAFGGMVSGAICYWYVMIKDTITRAIKNKETLIIIILISIVLLLSTILIIGLLQIVDLTIFINTTPIFLAAPFWEWMLLFSLTFHVLIIGLIVPKKVRILR